MTPGQLLDAIRKHLQQDNASALHGRSRSLSSISREIAYELSGHKPSVPSPIEPLPSAECLAAFSEGEASPVEASAVLSACVHDPGMLLQLLSIEELRYPAPAVEMASSELQDRLFKLKPVHAAPPAAKIVLPTTSVESIVESASSRTLVRSRQSKRLMAGVLAASLAFIAIGMTLTIRHWNTTDIAADDTLQVGTNMNSVADVDADSPSVHEPIPSLDGRPKSEVPLIADVPLNRDPDVSDPEVMDPARENVPNDDSRLQSPPALVDNATPQSSSPANTDLPPQPSTKLASFNSLAWSKVVGLLAQPASLEYDTWKVAAGERVAQPSYAPAIVEESSWLTLPRCYAEAHCENGSKLVLNQDSLVHVTPSDRALNLQIDFGAVALRQLPKDARVRIKPRNGASWTIATKSPASLHAWLENGQLYVAIDEGEVELEGQVAPTMRSIGQLNGTLQIGNVPLELPEWCVALPRESEVPRSVLANFETSSDLGKTVDQQLQRFAKLRSTPQNRKLLETLVMWRISIGVHDPLELAQHPLLPVRAGLFNAILSDSRDPRTSLARRQLNALLPPGTFDKWKKISRREATPTRQDIGAWLGGLAGRDTTLAALSDFMLRTQYSAGPDFVPSGTAAQRDAVRSQWTRVIIGQ